MIKHKTNWFTQIRSHCRHGSKIQFTKYLMIKYEMQFDSIKLDQYDITVTLILVNRLTRLCSAEYGLIQISMVYMSTNGSTWPLPLILLSAFFNAWRNSPW